MAQLAARLAAIGPRFERWAAGQARYAICGRVERAVGLLLEASGVRQPVGSRCYLELPYARLPAEVVGFTGERSFLMPLAPPAGVFPGVRVVPSR